MAPTVTKVYVTTEASIIINGFPSTIDVGIQHASVVSAKSIITTGIIPLTGKKAMPIAASKGHHPVYSWPL